MPIDNARPVIQMSLQGEKIGEFPSAKAAAKQFGGTESARQKIMNACKIKYPNGFKLKNNIAHNYKWKYAN